MRRWIDSKPKKRKVKDTFGIASGIIGLSDDENPKAATQASVPSSVANSDNEEQGHKTPQKRRRLAKDDPLRKRPYMPRKPGSLKKLLDMPFDIICEVFGHLDPIDLLSLTRTTKSMRTLLLTRSTAITIWRTSLDRYPDLLDLHPSDMAEPAFAYLMFGRNCHVCVDFISKSISPQPASIETIDSARKFARVVSSECDEPDGTFIGEFKKMPEYDESVGYPKELWDQRPSILVPVSSQIHIKPHKRYVRAVSAGLDARWAREYEEAQDKHAWVKAKLEELEEASIYQFECIEWTDEYVAKMYMSAYTAYT